KEELMSSVTGSTASFSSTLSASRCCCSLRPQGTSISMPTAGAHAETAVRAIERRWGEPGAGIWELEPRHWTHRRRVCVAGLRATCGRKASERATASLALADAIVAETAAGAVHRDGRWQRSPSDDRVDAALLLPTIREGLAPDDPRSLATLRAVERDLTDDGF